MTIPTANLTPTDADAWHAEWLVQAAHLQHLAHAMRADCTPDNTAARAAIDDATAHAVAACRGLAKIARKD